MLLAYVTFQYKEINGSLKADIYLNNKNKYICAFFESKIMICTALIEKKNSSNSYHFFVIKKTSFLPHQESKEN